MKEIAKQVLSLIDLTTLNDNDTPQSIIDITNKASTRFGNVPAICIYSRFITQARDLLEDTGIKIATVTNFPHGSTDLELALYETSLAINRGADEVDIVFPYHALIQGDSTTGAQMIKEAKYICADKILKVIIESGELQDPKLIKLASEISIANGADFIKTSTGKVKTNATLEATEIMLHTIKLSGKACGFKAAGGIKTVVEAQKYLDLAKTIMGDNWINANNFRFGASGLLGDVLAILEGTQSTAQNASY